MGIIQTLLLVLFAVSAVLLIIVVLMQDDQGEGLGGIFGGGSSAPFGSSSGNVLTKITGVLGVLFIVSSLGLAYMVRTPEDENVLGEARRSTATEQSENWFDDSSSEDSSSSDN
ncbi:MAG: preprotein translocase subunit SecG [Spirochaetaceae bacterium]|nr:preprotein translocase subunit SecG [Spirochaetaceae bacterium]